MTDETAEKKPAPQADGETPGGAPQPRLGRRLLVLRAALGAAAATATAQAAEALDPTPVQYRSGITDSDPNDSPCYGRGYRGRPRTGITDSDPSDGPGYGRGGYRGRGALSAPF